jgi:hypothetical protein
MKIRTVLFTCALLSLLLSNKGMAQSQQGKKGQLFFFWGYNTAAYGKSDIHFKGTDYDFTLRNVVAKDRQTPFNFKTYFHPESFTIPQYNFRIGYFITDRWSISVGSDHMKYVMQANQTVTIDGYIRNSGTPYDGDYQGDDITLTTDFLQFEHTDGLNYLNLSARYLHPVYTYKMLALNLIGGMETGVLLPKTNTTLLSKERYDAFHFSGYGISSLGALNFELYQYLFIQAELKGGLIHMPAIRTTTSTTDKANQHFFFLQPSIVLGANIPLHKKTS